MYQRILIAYDGTRQGRIAIREGVLLAQRCGAEIHVLAVVAETPGMLIAEGAYPGALAQQQENYDAILEEAVGGLAQRGVKLQARLVRGEPAQEIAAYAAKVRADLVVVGHHKQNLLQRWWSGPTGAYLSDHLTCSLLIARAQISREEFVRRLDSAMAETTADT